VASVFFFLAQVTMGNWQLEVGKMALYIFLPVGAFYLFHQVCFISFQDGIEIGLLV
jgi:hypothetical protein